MKKNTMKILELCPYSAGGCGVWARAKQESQELIKKSYEVQIFSSNLEKGTNKIVSELDNIGKLKIQRFPAKKLGGESFMFWLNEKAIKQAINYSPDIIIAHTYRHLHSTRAIKIKKELLKQGKKCKVLLVTHAPFVEGNITRTKIQTLIVNLYDFFVGRYTLNKFDKILAISNWEIPYLIKAGAKKEKVSYVPNGIPEEFFRLKKQTKEENKAIFLGRIAPKKKIETIIEAIPLIKNKEIIFEMIGPVEEAYKKELDTLIKTLGVEKRIYFSSAIYDLKDKIKKIDSAKIYILASRVEGMPQGLIEAMSRGKIVIGSNSLAIRDIIQDGKNGYLFEFDNPKSLANVINKALLNLNISNRLSINAKENSEKFSWSKIIVKLTDLF
jgi:glycosyltransferase involved in cell wall biosynthesis